MNMGLWLVQKANVYVDGRQISSLKYWVTELEEANVEFDTAGNFGNLHLSKTKTSYNYTV
jgi:hypothetical protein